jgi:hypothetical protein
MRLSLPFRSGAPDAQSAPLAHCNTPAERLEQLARSREIRKPATNEYTGGKVAGNKKAEAHFLCFSLRPAVDRSCRHALRPFRQVGGLYQYQ